MERVRGEGPRLVEKLCFRAGGGFGGGCEGGGVEGRVGGGCAGGESGLGRRGPALGCLTWSRMGELLPVLSVRWMDRAVVWSSEAGVGLGVPRTLPSGRALLGGRGSEMRELATSLFGHCWAGSWLGEREDSGQRC